MPIPPEALRIVGMTSIGFASGLSLVTVVLAASATVNAVDSAVRRHRAARAACEASAGLIGKPLGARPAFPTPPWAPWLTPDFRGGYARLQRPPLLGMSNR
jgi:hypothetical protein